MKKTEALNLLNKRKSNLLKAYPSLADDLQKYNGYLCGGVWVDSLLETKYKDLDIYFDSVENADAFAKARGIKNPVEGKSNLHFGKFEIMRFVTYPTAMDCINDFDFSCCQIAWDGVTFYFGEHTLHDIESRYLRLLDIHAPLVPTLQRIIKYINKGFKPDEHTFGTICKYIKQKGIDDVPLKFEAYEEAVDELGEIAPPPQQRREINGFIVDAVDWQLEVIRRQVNVNGVPAGWAAGAVNNPFGWDNI